MSFPDPNGASVPGHAGQAPSNIPPNSNRNTPSDPHSSQGAQGQTITPEPRPGQVAMNNHTSQTTPSTPGLLAPFDWEDFQSRYEEALAEIDKDELAILKEFEGLSKYFNVWASSASARDNERATKRLQTRQRYVSLSEENMAQKQKHYDEVLRAFQSALALLSSK
ncbi:uncharacterized protein DNG_10382 [Cephalotrichum gorgonifer]|uniref:Uncharacterized protein n=1 Tax=Cephalotrichum gorgonifer TaxID=2041049 RepID=A0AAE8N7L9_9PEZI|nr:uncharacterized protein DNG_10382 [Cephalotrichum gorgonifer]